MAICLTLACREVVEPTGLDEATMSYEGEASALVGAAR